MYLSEAGSAPPAELAKARFVLAQTLWTAGVDLDDARMLAEQARQTYEAAGLEKDVRSVTGWLSRQDATRQPGPQTD